MRDILTVAVVIVCCLTLAVGVGAAAHEEADRDVVGVELDAEGGGADVVHVTSYNLSVDGERDTYESFVDNETAQDEWREMVAGELEDAAELGRGVTADDEFPLEMEIRDVRLETDEVDGHGRIEVHARWENLAYWDDTRVVVVEPFASGYEPDRSVAIHGPDGYVRGTVNPAPSRAQHNSAVLTPETGDFSEFFVEFTDPEADESGNGDDGATEGQPADTGLEGLGVFLRALAIAALPLAALLLAVRRYRAA